MNEIEKLYENAGLANMWVEEYDDKQFWHGCYNEMIQSMMKLNDWDRKTAISVAHKECRKAHPLFTAEKQLELIKFIGLNYGLKMIKNEAYDHILMTDLFADNKYNKKGYGYGFDEAIANLINNLWQDLTSEEKEQIRGILNG